MAAQPVGRTEQISRHYLGLRRMLWRHFSAEKPWVLEWIRIPSDACGRANSIWIRYMWTGKFLNPERKSCGFKNIRIRVDGALVYTKTVSVVRGGYIHHYPPPLRRIVVKYSDIFFLNYVRPAVHANKSVHSIRFVKTMTMKVLHELNNLCLDFVLQAKQRNRCDVTSSEPNTNFWY